MHLDYNQQAALKSLRDSHVQLARKMLQVSIALRTDDIKLVESILEMVFHAGSNDTLDILHKTGINAYNNCDGLCYPDLGE